MKKILITGGSGFIGTYILRELKNEYTIVLDLKTPKEKCSKYYKYNVLKPLDWIFEKEKPDIVIHLAAQTDVGRSIHNPKFDAKNNIIGSINVFETSLKYKCKVVAANSAAALDLQNPYGISKHAMFLYSKYFKNVINLYLSNVYGKESKGVIGIIHRYLMGNTKKPFSLYGGKQIRDFVYVKDVARAFVRALDFKGIDDFIISTNKGNNILGAYLMAQTVYKIKKLYVVLAQKKNEIQESILDNTKTIKKLKWKPLYTLKKGLEDMTKGG